MLFGAVIGSSTRCDARTISVPVAALTDSFRRVAESVEVTESAYGQGAACTASGRQRRSTDQG